MFDGPHWQTWSLFDTLLLLSRVSFSLIYFFLVFVLLTFCLTSLDKTSRESMHFLICLHVDLICLKVSEIQQPAGHVHAGPRPT